MRVARVVGAVDCAGNHISRLEIIGGLRVHLLDFDGFCDVVVLSVGAESDIIGQRVHRFDSGRALIKNDMKVIVVARENLVSQELSEVIIDEIFGLPLAEKRNVTLINRQIKEVDIGARSEFVQDTLAFGKGEGARLDFWKRVGMVRGGEMLLLLANDAFSALGGLVSLKNSGGEDEITTTAAEITRLVDKYFDHGAIIAVLKIITKHKRDEVGSGG